MHLIQEAFYLKHKYCCVSLLSIHRFNISFPNGLIGPGYTLSVIRLDMEGDPSSIMFCPFCFVMLHILQIPSKEDGWFLSLSYYHKGLFILITLMSCGDWGRISLESGCYTTGTLQSITEGQHMHIIWFPNFSISFIPEKLQWWRKNYCSKLMAYEEAVCGIAVGQQMHVIWLLKVCVLCILSLLY
jgi:hypothetical protein